MSFDARVAELGLTLYGPHHPPDPLDGVVVHDRIARTSGTLPRIDGELTAIGVLGHTLIVKQGYDAARVCALNALALLRDKLGTLDRIERVLTLTVFVACTNDFEAQPAVADGASEVLVEVFGEAGRHSRSASGVMALPRRAAVEIELTVALTH